MNSSFFKASFSFSIAFFIIILFICIFFIPLLSIFPESFSFSDSSTSSSFIVSNSNYIWPIPGYTRITSPFGKRISPTAGASSFHKGIDIAAPEGTNLYSITDGEITFANFLGGGGYTITLSYNNLKISYCHVNPKYIVKVGDIVFKGQLIGHVGPKYVYDVPGNPYKDRNGKPTNGAITGCHLHLGIRRNNDYINPLELFEDS